MLYSEIRDDGVKGVSVDRLDSTSLSCPSDDLAGAANRLRSVCRGGGGESKDVAGTTVFTISKSSSGTP